MLKKILFAAAISISLIQINMFGQCFTFYDGFESGNYTPTWSIGTGLTSGAVTTTSPAAGLYRLEGYGGTSTHLTGFSTIFTAATPSSISWWINPQGTVSTNYMVAGDAAVSATNCIVFCYWRGAGSQIRFVSSVNYDFPATSGNWYFIELQNINWTAHTFDIYINGALQYTSFPFRSATQNSVSRVHLYNFNSGTAVWDEVTIGNNPITLNYTATNLLCNGDFTGSIDLTATSINAGGFTFDWSNGSSTEDLTGISAGNYAVVVTDTAGCIDSISNIVVTEPMPISANFGFIPPLCNGGNDGSASIFASGGTPGYTYLWETASTSSSITNLNSGYYNCLITDTNNCQIFDSVFVSEPSPISISFTSLDPSTCGGNDGSIDATVSGGTPGYVYNWSNSSTVEDISGLSEGNYTIIVTDTNSCIDSNTVTLNDPTPTSISLSIPEDSVCINYTSFTLTGESTPGGIYSGTGVSTGMFDPSIAGIGTAVITYTYTDPNNCISMAQDNIVVISCLGTGDSDFANGYTLYPNPADDYFIIQLNEQYLNAEWKIFNDLGQEVKSGILTSINESIQSDDLTTGVYHIMIQSGNNQMVKKLIIR